jgi:hypothetical protein
VGDSGREVIAAGIDADRWGPAFARYGKRYRTGVSTFGRARLIPAAGTEGRYPGIFGLWASDLKPLDVAANPAFRLASSRNETDELVLDYRAERETRIGYQTFRAGETIQFILASPEMIRDAVRSVRRMPGPNAGVVFFRWPSKYEVLTMQPEEVLAAAGLEPEAPGEPVLETASGGCAAVECVDVYLRDNRPLSPNPRRVRIRSSTDLEYFLPEENVPVRMIGPSDLELTLPPFGGRGRLHLGRAVSMARAEFTVERP